MRDVFQVAELDPVSGELSKCRFAASRELLDEWAMRRRGVVSVVAVGATTSWRWAVAGLQRARVGGAAGRPGPGERVAGEAAAAEDRPVGRALAVQLLARAS
jgi:hypothetical protein